MRRVCPFLLAMVLGAYAGVVLPASQASAAAPCGAAGSFNGTETCTYTAVGADTFTVPAGVTTLTIVAIGGGGAGGNSVYGASAGNGGSPPLGVTSAGRGVAVGRAGSAGRSVGRAVG